MSRFPAFEWRIGIEYAGMYSSYYNTEERTDAIFIEHFGYKTNPKRNIVQFRSSGRRGTVKGSSRS